MSSVFWEGMIVPLDWHFVVYPVGAGVDEGAGVDQGDLFYTGTHGVEEGAGIEEESDRCRRQKAKECLLHVFPGTGSGWTRYILAGWTAGIEAQLYPPQYSKSCGQCTKIIIKDCDCDVNNRIKVT